MEREELNSVLQRHGQWLRREPGGQRANLSRANLSRANLSRANLSRANLSRANLSRADLSGANLFRANLSEANLFRANLSEASLSEANLSRANLSRANLSGARLSRADLSRADLSGANLSEANLSGTDLSEANLPPFQIPQEGPLIVWKATQGGVAKLRIPAEARRTATPVGRKCRAEYAEVLEVIGGEGRGLHDHKTVYTPGQVVRPDSYDDGIRVECTHGIHFFLTREEAENY